MNKSLLNSSIALAVLLGASLALPGTAAAHDNTPTFKVEGKHHKHHHHSKEWYVVRHREVSRYGTTVRVIRTKKSCKRDLRRSPVRVKIVL
jgi:hypothetical protein